MGNSIPDTAVRKLEWKSDYFDESAEIIHGNKRDAETLKLTHCRNVTVGNKMLTGSREDVVDIVKGLNIVLHSQRWQADSDTRVFLTAKGGIKGLHLKDITLSGDTRWPWDYSFGDWTLYDHNPKRPPVRNIVVEDNNHVSGRPIVALCLHSERPKVIRSNMRLWVVPRIPVRVWFAFLRAVRKAPDPQKYAMEVFDWEL